MKSKISFLRWGCLGVLCMGALLAFGLFAISVRPSIGAHGADLLRSIIGNQAVTLLENVAFQVRDAIQQQEYKLGLVQPVSPWQVSTVQTSPIAPTPMPTFTLPAETAVPTQALTSTPPTKTVVPTRVPTRVPTPQDWRPAPAKPLGSLQGEGIWTPYIQTFWLIGNCRDTPHIWGA
jgi:hypothetical protein